MQNSRPGLNQRFSKLKDKPKGKTSSKDFFKGLGNK